MEMSRRGWFASCALAMGLSGCTAVNPAPELDADAAGTIAPGELLKNPGDQVKVHLPGGSEAVLVWRSAQGYGAASIVCPHRGSEVHYNAAAGRLDCPSHGSQFAPDGRVVRGPATRPLTAYRVEVEGDRLALRRG